MTREKANEALVKALRKRSAPAVEEASRLLAAAFRSRTPLDSSRIVLSSERAAYRVQDAVFADLWPGARAAAWKAGAPSDQVEPAASPIPAENVLVSPASVRGAAMHMIGVEAEVAFRFAKDLPPRSRPYSDKSVAAAVGEVLVAIELCDTRLANYKEASGLWKLADFQSNSGLVTGSGTADWHKVDFAAQACEFHVGGHVSRAKGAHPLGNPFRLLPWLVRHCTKRGHGLHAGDVVTTGSWTGMEFAKVGDEVRAVFPGIGEATVRIA